MIIFYTQNECLATIDCVHYAWVYPRDIFFDVEDEAGNLSSKEFKVNEGWNIKDVTACDGFCIISYESVENESDCHDVRVTFNIDNLSRGMISYETVWYHQ